MARSTDLLRELNGEIVCIKPRTAGRWKRDAAALVFAGAVAWLLAVLGLTLWVAILTLLAVPSLMMLTLTNPRLAGKVLRVNAAPYCGCSVCLRERSEKPVLTHTP